MKHFILGLCLLVVSAIATPAQTTETYNVTQNTPQGITPGIYRAIRLEDDATMTVELYTSCYQKSGVGSVNLYGTLLTLNASNPCIPLTGSSASTTIVTGTGGCKGPLSRSFTGADVDANGVPFTVRGTLYFSYYMTQGSGRGGGGAGCHQLQLASVVVVHPNGSTSTLYSNVVITQ